VFYQIWFYDLDAVASQMKNTQKQVDYQQATVCMAKSGISETSHPAEFQGL
jgi:hypothetical protein